jgi:hypothetical protein
VLRRVDFSVLRRDIQPFPAAACKSIRERRVQVADQEIKLTPTNNLLQNWPECGKSADSHRPLNKVWGPNTKMKEKPAGLRGTFKEEAGG